MFFLHVFVHASMYLLLMRTEENTASTGTGVKDGCGPPCGWWEVDMGPQQEQLRALDCQDISPTPRDTFQTSYNCELPFSADSFIQEIAPIAQ